jgi:hypothetical protein
MAEAASHEGDYGSALRGIARALWNGDMDRAEAANALGLQIERGLRWAWIEGTETAGISRDEMTEEDFAGLEPYVAEEFQHVGDLLDFIEKNSKAEGGKLGTCVARIDLWVRRYQAVVNAAMAAARSNPKLKWRLGATKEHCKDCAGYNGKVYRANTWLSWGAMPQSQDLECSGYNCDCRLEPTDDPLTRGHPAAPSGR